jgi:hypothetical protein
MAASYSSASRRLTSGEPVVEGAADNTGLGGFGVADLPSFVYRLAGEAKVGGGRQGVPIWNTRDMLITAELGNLAPLLRGIVFVRQPALGLRLDALKLD